VKPFSLSIHVPLFLHGSEKQSPISVTDYDNPDMACLYLTCLSNVHVSGFLKTCEQRMFTGTMHGFDLMGAWVCQRVGGFRKAWKVMTVEVKAILA